MPTAQVDVSLPGNKLLEAIEKMSLPELEHLFSLIIALRAQHKAPHLSAKESELLLKINQGLPSEVRTRLNKLAAKRRANTLTTEEQHELIGLTNQLENAEAKRVEALGELARLRGVSVTALMQELGIRAPEYA
jgi:hypothetical protein